MLGISVLFAAAVLPRRWAATMERGSRRWSEGQRVPVGCLSKSVRRHKVLLKRTIYRGGGYGQR